MSKKPRLIRITDSGKVLYKAEKPHCHRFPEVASEDLGVYPLKAERGLAQLPIDPPTEPVLDLDADFLKHPPGLADWEQLEQALAP